MRSDGTLAEGEATAICAADLGGVLSNCRVIMERPEGAGFGAALLNLSKYYRASPTRRACAREGGSFVFIGHDEPEPETPAKLVSTPSPWEMYKGWPEALRRQHRDGFALVLCRPHENGEVTDCRSLYEFPEGFGVSAAALALMPRYRVSPAQGGGQLSLDHPVGIPLRFVLSPLAQCPY